MPPVRETTETGKITRRARDINTVPKDKHTKETRSVLQKAPSAETMLRLTVIRNSKHRIGRQILTCKETLIKPKGDPTIRGSHRLAERTPFPQAKIFRTPTVPTGRERGVRDRADSNSRNGARSGCHEATFRFCT